MEGIESRLKEERRKMGITQKQLADGVGISERSIINFENGRVPSLPTAMRLADFFHTSVERLFRLPENTLHQ